MRILYNYAFCFFPLTFESEVSDKATEFAMKLCAGVTDLAKVDSSYADLVSVFIGSENYIEKVCVILCVFVFGFCRFCTTLNAVI